MTGPRSPGTVSQAMAETSSFLGVPRTRSSRATGVIIEPPTPWRKRERTKAWIDPDKPQAIEPSTKIPIAIRKMFLAPKRSDIQPLIGMKMARATR